MDNQNVHKKIIMYQEAAAFSFLFANSDFIVIKFSYKGWIISVQNKRDSEFFATHPLLESFASITH